jgi:hypothetical protein
MPKHSSASLNPNQPDPNSFRIPASDSQGHNSKLYFRCQPGHAQQLEMVVQSKKFPFRNIGEIIRHAIVRELVYLEGLEPMKSITGQVDAIIEVMRDEEFAGEFAKLFDRLGQRIASHLGSGSDGEARRLVLIVQEKLGDMPEGYWKDRYQQEVEVRYGHLVTNAPKCRLYVAPVAGEGDGDVDMDEQG